MCDDVITITYLLRLQNNVYAMSKNPHMLDKLEM